MTYFLQVAKDIGKVFPFHPELAVEGQLVFLKIMTGAGAEREKFSAQLYNSRKKSEKQANQHMCVQIIDRYWKSGTWVAKQKPHPITISSKLAFSPSWIFGLAAHSSERSLHGPPHSSSPQGFRNCTKRMPSTSLAWRTEYLRSQHTTRDSNNKSEKPTTLSAWSGARSPSILCAPNNWNPALEPLEPLEPQTSIETRTPLSTKVPQRTLRSEVPKLADAFQNVGGTRFQNVSGTCFASLTLEPVVSTMLRGPSRPRPAFCSTSARSNWPTQQQSNRIATNATVVDVSLRSVWSWIWSFRL